MEYKQIPKVYRDLIKDTKHGSYTINSDVIDACENAKNWKEAQKAIKAYMENLIDEATEAIRHFTNDKTYILRMALQRITMEHIDEVEENCGQTWYRVGKQWHFVMTAECDK